jgi:hypothetical protein
MKFITKLLPNFQFRYRWENWMHLAQDRDQWQTLVNIVMKPQVP